MSRERLLTNYNRCLEVVHTKILSILNMLQTNVFKIHQATSWKFVTEFCFSTSATLWAYPQRKMKHSIVWFQLNIPWSCTFQAEIVLNPQISGFSWTKFFCKKGNLRQQPCASKNNNFFRKTWRVHKYPQEKIIQF